MKHRTTCHDTAYLRRLTHSKSMHWHVEGSNGEDGKGFGGYYRRDLVFAVSLLAANRDAGKGKQYSARYRLSKPSPRRGKHAEEQRICQLGTGLVIRVAGDDFVVVDPAFAVDESLHHDRVVTVGCAFSRLQ